MIRKRLEKDKTLKERTNLNFRFGGEIYQQKFGAAMGSPVSPIVVNLYIEDLEHHCKPRNWKRYVDDVICLVHKEQAEELPEHMNSVKLYMQHTFHKRR